MALPVARVHRLPPQHKRDYTLVPAPLDLSLPIASEKSPLPAIIVTPSSPCSSHDFSIAFLAPPPKPSLRERLSMLKPYHTSFSARLRSFLIVFLIIFILVCHVVSHRLAARRPHLEFAVQQGDVHLIETSTNWFDFRSLFGGEPEPITIVTDLNS